MNKKSQLGVKVNQKDLKRIETVRWHLMRTSAAVHLKEQESQSVLEGAVRLSLVNVSKETIKLDILRERMEEVETRRQG